mgnify:CR=1 FL=1
MTEFWLRKATSLITESEKKTDLEAQTIFQKARVGRVYGPLTDGFAVKVDFTEYGRAIFATDNILSGKCRYWTQYSQYQHEDNGSHKPSTMFTRTLEYTYILKSLLTKLVPLILTCVNIWNVQVNTV